MRKYLPSIAMEHQVALEAMPVLSLEEEQIEVAEQAAEANEIAQELTESERIIEVSDALEDLAVIADGIEEATPAEVQLIAAAGDLAVAGTDVTPEELIPAIEISPEVAASGDPSLIATESRKALKLATEGIVEKARDIWERIVAFLKQVWERIEAFIYRVIGYIPRIRKSILSLEEKLDDIVGKKAEGKLKIAGGVSALSVAGAPVKSEADLKKALGDLDAAAKFVFGKMMDSMVKRGEVCAAALDNFDAAKAPEAAKELRAKLAANGVDEKVPGGSGGDKNRFPGFITTTGTPLLGNVSLAAKRYYENADNSDLGSLDRQRHSSYDLVPSSDKAYNMAGKSVEMDPLTSNAIRDILKGCTAILDTLEEYKRGSKGKAVTKARKDMEAASSKAAGSFSKLRSSSEEADKAAVPYLKAMLNFNQAYARWVQSPAIPLMNNSLQSLRAVLVVCQKSVAAHK